MTNMLTKIRRFAGSRVLPPKNLDCVIFFFIWLYSIPFLGLALTIAVAIYIKDYTGNSENALIIGGIFAIPHVIDIIVRIVKLIRHKDDSYDSSSDDDSSENDLEEGDDDLEESSEDDD